MKNIKRYIGTGFFMPDQKKALNPTDKFIHKKMKKMGIQEYLIRKHVHIIVNKKDTLKFDETDDLEKGIKEALEKSDGSCTIYLRTR